MSLWTRMTRWTGRTRPVGPGPLVQAADRVPEEPGSAGPGAVAPTGDPEFLAGLRPIPTGPRGAPQSWPAADLLGEDPGGHPVAVRIGEHARPLLLCFLQTRCDGCHEFWLGLADPPGEDWPDGLSLVAVTRGPGTVDRSEVARLAAGAGAGAVSVVMSDQAWDDYRITGYPFFVLVDPSPGTVVGETVGFGWSDVRAMVHAAMERGRLSGG
jgi:hypothetical protein